MSSPTGGIAPPDYSTAGTATPTGVTGTTDIWGLPSGLGETNIWFDTGNYGAKRPNTVNPSGSNQARAKEGDIGSNQADVTPFTPGGSFEKTMTADDVMRQVAAMSMNDPMGYAALQKLLAAGNYYDSATRVYGTWNQTEAALGRALSDYIKVTHNNQGEGAGVPVSFQEYLQHVAAVNQGLNGNPGNGTAGGGAGGGTPAPSVVALADPDTLTRYAQMAAQSALGRALKPNEIEAFVNEFHNQQMQSATTTVDDKSAAKGSGQGGVVGMADKNDPRSSAIGFVEGTNKDEFAQHQIQGYADTFLNMFLPSGSAAPNVNVDPSAIGF